MTAAHYIPVHPPVEVVAERRRIIRKRTMQGATLEQIATELRISTRQVSRVRTALGLSTGKFSPLTDQERHDIEWMIADGWSYAEIGRTIGRSTDAISRNYPNQSKFELLGRHHLKLANLLGLQVIW